MTSPILENFRIPLKEIVRATDNFSLNSWLGDGGYGVVYKGQLSERWQNKTVAIKRVNENSNQSDDDFRYELQMLVYFNHESVNVFVGYSDEGGEMIIAYEFAVNGSLDYLLQDPDRMRFLTWSQRLKICVGAARGLNHLHTGLPENKTVIHRNVKSANIVFDHNMEAMICGFDISVLCSKDELHTVDSSPLGTPFYMDPVYNETGILRTELDVYSFGVVLFEILSGMLAYDPRSVENGDPQPLMNLVRHYHDYGQEKLIDPFIKDQIDSPSFKKFTDVAYQCISLDPDQRPTMEIIINKLEEALDSHHMIQ